MASPHRALRLILTCLIPLAAPACGDGDEGGGDDAPDVDAAPDDIDAAPDAAPAVTLADLCGPDGALTALFEKVIACNPALDLLLFQGRANAAGLAALCDGAVGPFLDDGSIALPTWEQIDACRAYVDATACLDVDFVVDRGPCDLFVGQVAAGGDCESSEQCVAEAYCDTTGGGDCGTCAARKADGMTCAGDGECAGGACIGTQCGSPGDDGDPCLSAGPGDDPNNDCRGQRVCDTDQNECVTLPAWQVNQVCTPNTGDCDPLGTGLWCQPSGDAGQCAPMLADGAVCRNSGVAQGVCDIRAYLTCPAGANATCTPPVTVTTEGDACGFFAGAQCAAGLVCTNPITMGVCVEYQAEGETCENGGAATDQCDLFLGCVDGECAYGDYSGTCPAP